MAKCRRCQPVITYRETISLSQVAFSAIRRCSVDGDVDTSSVKEQGDKHDPESLPSFIKAQTVDKTVISLF